MSKKSKKQKEEEQMIEHVNFGIDLSGKAKGVEIKAGSGIKDLNPNPEKGVEIHNARHG